MLPNFVDKWGLAARKFTFRQQTSSTTDDWPTGISEAAGVRLAKRQLKASGWRMLPPWPWINVLVRAERSGIVLNMMVYDSRTLRLHTALKDLAYSNREKRDVIGVLVLDDPIESDLGTFERSGIFVLAPHSLSGVEADVVRVRRSILDGHKLTDELG